MNTYEPSSRVILVKPLLNGILRLGFRVTWRETRNLTQEET